MPVGQAIGYFRCYTVDEVAMTVALHIEPCAFPGWNGIDRVSKTVSVLDDELRTEAALVYDPVNGEIVPHQ